MRAAIILGAAALALSSISWASDDFDEEAPTTRRHGSDRLQQEPDDSGIIDGARQYRRDQEQPPRFALDPSTGAVYPGVGSGAINPQNGDYYPRVHGGFIDPKTGQLFPGN